jgi:hypothetical protein
MISDYCWLMIECWFHPAQCIILSLCMFYFKTFLHKQNLRTVTIMNNTILLYNRNIWTISNVSIQTILERRYCRGICRSACGSFHSLVLSKKSLNGSSVRYVTLHVQYFVWELPGTDMMRLKKINEIFILILKRNGNKQYAIPFILSRPSAFEICTVHYFKIMIMYNLVT